MKQLKTTTGSKYNTYLRNSFKLNFSVDEAYLTSSGILGSILISGTRTHNLSLSLFSQYSRTKDHHLKQKSHSGSISITCGLIVGLQGTHGLKEPKIHVYTQGSLMRPETWVFLMRNTHTHTENTKALKGLLYMSLFIIVLDVHSVCYVDNAWMQRRTGTRITCSM